MATGAQLQTSRQIAGMTQAQLGKRVGLKQNTIAAYEKMREIPLRMLRKFDKAFGNATWRTQPTPSVVPQAVVRDAPTMSHDEVVSAIVDLQLGYRDLSARLAALEPQETPPKGGRFQGEEGYGVAEGKGGPK